MVNKISLYKNLNQVVDQRWNLKPEVRQSLPLHSIISDFKILTTEDQNRDFYKLSKKVKILSEEKINYYHQCLFRIVTKIFSCFRNWWNHGQFISSGQLGLELSTAFIHQYKAHTKKEVKAPPLSNSETKAPHSEVKVNSNPPQEELPTPKKEVFEKETTSQTVIAKEVANKTQAEAITSSVLQEPALPTVTSVPQDLSSNEAVSETSLSQKESSQSIELQPPKKEANPAESKEHSSSATLLPSECIAHQTESNTKVTNEDQPSSGIVVSAPGNEPQTPSSLSIVKAAVNPSTPQMKKFMDDLSKSPHATLIRSLSTICKDETEKTYVEIIIHSLISCGNLKKWKQEKDKYHLEFAKKVIGKPENLPMLIKHIELNQNMVMGIERKGNQISLTFSNKSICVNPHVGFRSEINVFPIEKKNGVYVCQLSALKFTIELNLEEAIDMWTKTKWE